MPGIWVQKITTRQPTDDMIEVAIVSLEEALVADGETVPEGSSDFAHAPLDPPAVPGVAAAVAVADGPEALTAAPGGDEAAGRP
jgi:hypothetical protein